MNILKGGVIALVAMYGVVAFVPTVRAADYCFCIPTPDATKDKAKQNLNGPADPVGPQIDATCPPKDPAKACGEMSTPLMRCEERDTLANCEASKQAWRNTLKAEEKKASTIGIGIPTCLTEPVLSGDCRDIAVFIRFLINITNWAFGIIGAVALAVFIYGGFMLIISSGNAEKVQQGMGILMSAVVGLFVAFAGYMLIQFVADAVGVKELYKLL